MKFLKNENLGVLLSVLIIFLSGFSDELVLALEVILLAIQFKKIKYSKSFFIIIVLILIHAGINVLLGNDTIVLAIKQLLGISISFTYYYSVLDTKEKANSFFKYYIYLSLAVAFLCIIQQIAFKLSLPIIYDLRWLIKDQLMPSIVHYRAAAIFREPSEVALILAPAAFSAMYYFVGKRNQFLKDNFSPLVMIMIMIGYVCTLSTMAFISIIIGSLLIFFEFSRNIKSYLFFFVILAAIGLMYSFIPDFKLRVNDSIRIMFSSDSSGSVNLSNQTLKINEEIAFRSFKNTYGLGGGIGSHQVSYNKLIGLYKIRGIQMYLNKEDANSQFLRLISELGVLGILIVLYFYKKYRKYINEDELMYLLHKMCIIYFILRLIRYGHYFNDGMFAFVVLYMLTSINYYTKKKEKGDKHGL